MTHAELEKTFIDAGLNGDLIDDLAYQDSVADLIDNWKFRIVEIQRYINHAKKYDGELLGD
jgi:hypothetical protein